MPNMMKYLFGVILLVHGLIHVMGFTKSFQLAEMNQLSQSISKPFGILWLFTFFLFLMAAVLFFLKKEEWPILAILAVVISQTLIILYWKDAKYGTIVNFIVLLISLSTYGNHQFTKMVQEESMALLQNIESVNPSVVNESDMAHLPPIIQKWMTYSGVVGHPKVVSVRLKQTGMMRTKPEGKWMPFTAEQYFDTKNPSFIWTAKVKAMPLIYLYGRDKFKDGNGEMLIKLLSMVPIVKEKNNEKINSDTMLRFLAEICWFPPAALNEYITWEGIGTTSAKATISLKEKSVSGIFKFSNTGELISFEAERYYGGGKEAKLEKWHIETIAYKDFNDLKIPYKSRVIWKLNEGDFNWLNLEVTDLEHNTTTVYEEDL